MKQLNKIEFKDFIADGIAVVDVWAAWCGPCRAFAPVFEKFAEKYGDIARFAKLNFDENPDTAAEYRINAIPTICFFKNGELKDKIVGLCGEEELKASLDRLK